MSTATFEPSIHSAAPITEPSLFEQAMAFLKDAATEIAKAVKVVFGKVRSWFSALLSTNAAVGSAATFLAVPAGNRMFVSAVDWMLRFAGKCLVVVVSAGVWLVSKTGDLITTAVSLFNDDASARFHQWYANTITGNVAKAMLAAVAAVSAAYARIRDAFTSRAAAIFGVVAAGVVALLHWAQVIPVVAAYAVPAIATMSAIPVVGWLFSAAASVGFAPLMFILSAMAAGAGVSLIAKWVSKKSSIDTQPTVMPNGDVKVPVSTDGTAVINAEDVPKVAGEYNRVQQQNRNASYKPNNPNQQRRGK